MKISLFKIVKKKVFGAFTVFIVFFIVGIATLPHYGINWDTINHLPRGQVYLHYFLTGEKDFSHLPKFFSGWQTPGQWYWQNPNTIFFDPDVPKEELPSVSLYQRGGIDLDYLMERDGGHPPLSDILSSAFNLVLFQKLRLINDIDSYRIYGVLLAAVLVGLIFYWTSKAYGNFAGLVAALSLSLHPLFWSESHFNTEKDVPETVFWAFLLFSVWKGVTGKSWRWFLLSGVFFGLALGTKFNVLFIAFVILPWLGVVLRNNYLKKSFRILKVIRENIKLVVAVLVAPFIGLGIFLASWPYLWPDPITRIGKIVGFYKGIGLTENVDVRFLGPFGTNTFPIQWLLYTTPLVFLGLSLLGLAIAVYRLRDEKDRISLLFLLWFTVPVARIVWPGTTVYGGVRQIMEYIPAMAILAGLGGMWVFEMLRKRASKMVAGAIVLAMFVPITLKLIQIHPNENAYFNPLIGGLAGAKERDFPFWGFSFGAPYRQGAKWLNENAGSGANVVYAYELIPNLPRIWLRRDLNLHNTNRTGSLRGGEYAITLSFDREYRSYYDAYLDRFLEPVYQVVVDGVPILKVWKNDESHTKEGYLREERISDVKFHRTEYGSLRVDLGEPYYLARIEAEISTTGCSDLKSAYSQVSLEGIIWERLIGVMPGENWDVIAFGEQPQRNKFFQPFAAEFARYIEYGISPVDACFGNITSLSVYHLPDLKQ